MSLVQWVRKELRIKPGKKLDSFQRDVLEIARDLDKIERDQKRDEAKRKRERAAAKAKKRHRPTRNR